MAEKRDPKLPDDNIYRQKFEAYYGRDVTCAAMNGPLDATPERTFAPRPEIKRLPLPESQLRLLVAVLGAEPGLVPIWNWQRKGVAANRQVPSVHNDQTDANSPNGYEGEPLQLEQRPDTTASAGRAGNRTGHERGPSHTRRTPPSGSSPPAR